MKNTKKHALILTLAGLVILLSVPLALSYFSTFTRVKGARTLRLYDDVTIIEREGENAIKHVELVVDENSDPVYVRLAVFAPTDIEALLEYGDENWTKDGIYYTYDQVLTKGQHAEFSIRLAEGAEIQRDDFDVIVVYEYTPALMDGSGNYYADWNQEHYSITPDASLGGEP